MMNDEMGGSYTRAWGKRGNIMAEDAADCVRALRVEIQGMMRREKPDIQAVLSLLLIAWKSLEMLLPPLAERGNRG
jgi:hypothetical protein